MRRRTNVASPVDTVNTLQEMLQATDSTTEDGETVWCRSAQTYFVYRIGSTLVPDGVSVVASLYGTPPGVWQRLDLGIGIDSDRNFARGVGPNGNVANLAAFTVAGNDGITYVAGDVVLLTAQTIVAQNGPYVVGTVAGGVAPLTRPLWWLTGTVFHGGQTIALGGQGTNWKNTIWEAMAPVSTFIVGTDDPLFFPHRFTRRITLASAAVVIPNLPIFSTSIGIGIVRVLNGVGTTTVQYAATTAAGASGITPGTIASGSLTITPELVGGATAAVDLGDIVVTVHNQSGVPVAAGTLPLGLAEGYVALAKTLISNVPTSAITGNLGLSPAAASFITGFALTLDGSNVFSTSAQVTGRVYAADYAVPTPANLTTAVLDMQAAYTDAASRIPNVTGLGGGNIGGMTLAPGVYKWTTGLLIPTSVTLSGPATGVWIFQVSGTLFMSAAQSVILAGGALARNVFWQVAGNVTLDTTSHMEGTVLGQTLIAMNAGASLTGRLLAQAAVTLISNTIIPPP